LDRSYGVNKTDCSFNIGWATDVIDDGINAFGTPKEHSLYATKINSILKMQLCSKD
jgi:hypothetical protein